MNNLRTIIALTLMLVCASSAMAAQTQDKDSKGTQLLNEVKLYFNSNDEQAFYQAAADYREFYLNEGDLITYYQGWEHEVLYDVNHGHFYNALRKTMTIQKDMRLRKAEDQYYKVNHLRGIIYSLRGNLPMAREYYEKALDQVNHSQPSNLVGIYMDLANIEMDSEPEEAMKHLDCAIAIIKANGARYEYSDAIGFKIIIAYSMRDWETVRNCYQEYMRLQHEYGQEFSMTYYNYAQICKYTADGEYAKALKETEKLTNPIDVYKFRSEVSELSGDNKLALEMQKAYMRVKDSVNNVIMNEEIMGTVNDITDAERARDASTERNKHLTWSLFGVAIAVGLMGYTACRLRRRKFMRQLKQQNAELKIARDKALEADRLKISFLQNMSHEVRTPLNIISGYAQIISDPKTLMSEQERADIASRITHSTRNIVHIIDEILDVSGKESVHFIDKSDEVGCNEMARNLLTPFENRQSNLDIRFETNLKDSFKIRTNRKEVEKIITHLLDNACKFTEKGSVTLRCQLDQLDNMVCFMVTDTGKGVREGEEEKIFEHFYKVDAYKEGIGLGLPLSRRVARQLGGDVVLESSYKQGSRFVLKLPRE